MTDLPPDHPAREAALRWLSDLLCLWGLCRNAACRRAQRCARQPDECLARYTPLVPDAAHDGVNAILDGLDRGLSYDELCDDAPAEIAAYEDWIARVQSSSTGGR